MNEWNKFVGFELSKPSGGCQSDEGGQDEDIDYKDSGLQNAYVRLFSEQTDAIEMLEELIAQMKRTQLQAEDAYIGCDDTGEPDIKIWEPRRKRAEFKLSLLQKLS
jgi:hypothetical protein